MNTIDEKILWQKYREEHDESARETLIYKYISVVRYIAGRIAIHLPPSIDIDDLVGWGIIGLLDAMERYDYKQETRFNTYASIRIRGTILDQIRSLDWAPRSLRSMARRVGSVSEKLRHEKGSEPTIQEIANALGVDSEHIEGTVTQLQTVQVLSLDHFALSDDDGVERTKEMNTNAFYPSPDDVARQKELQEMLVDAIMKLPEQQQKVLHLYYYEELTLKEIGEVLQVSESRVCQIHANAIKTLRELVKSWV